VTGYVSADSELIRGWKRFIEKIEKATGITRFGCFNGCAGEWVFRRDDRGGRRWRGFGGFVAASERMPTPTCDVEEKTGGKGEKKVDEEEDGGGEKVKEEGEAGGECWREAGKKRKKR
jgi:hypothetical protein